MDAGRQNALKEFRAGHARMIEKAADGTNRPRTLHASIRPDAWLPAAPSQLDAVWSNLAARDSVLTDTLLVGPVQSRATLKKFACFSAPILRLTHRPPVEAVPYPPRFRACRFSCDERLIVWLAFRISGVDQNKGVEP